MPPRRRYHHGALRRVVIDTAVEIIAEDGPAAISLRELARRAGVSHAAPAHHFKDKAGLLTAIAIEGNEMLADSLAEALETTQPALIELGVRYVKFAFDHPAHFEVMYRPDLYHRDDPELVAARDRAGRLLRAGVATLPNESRKETEVGAITSWSLAHGFATLWRSGNLDRFIEGRSPTETFRLVANFAAPAGSPSET